MSKVLPSNIRSLAVLKGSVVVNGKEEQDKNPYLSPATFPVSEPELNIGALDELLAWKSTKDAWISLFMALASLQTVMSSVTLFAFDRILRYLPVDKATGAFNMPINAIFLAGILILSGELFVLLIATRIVERHTKDILWHRALRHGVLIDFKNAKWDGRKNIGSVLYLLVLISAISLLFIGLNMESEYFRLKGPEYSALVINTLLGCIPLFMGLEKAFRPYKETELFESTLVPLPKYVEKDYNFSIDYLTQCKVIPEKFVLARLCDLNNYWQISVYELQMTWAEKYNYNVMLRTADFESQLGPDHLEMFREDLEKLKEECKVSFNMLKESQVEEKEENGGGLIVRNLICAKVTEKQFQYKLFDRNVRADLSSIVSGRYNNLLCEKMKNVPWSDEKLTEWFSSSTGKVSKASLFQGALIIIAGIFFISSGFFALWSVASNSLSPAPPPPPSTY